MFFGLTFFIGYSNEENDNVHFFASRIQKQEDEEVKLN